MAWVSCSPQGRAGDALAPPANLAMRVDGGFLSSRGQLVPLTPVVGLVLFEPGSNLLDGVEAIDDVIRGVWIT